MIDGVPEALQHYSKRDGIRVYVDSKDSKKAKGGRKQPVFSSAWEGKCASLQFMGSVFANGFIRRNTCQSAPSSGSPWLYRLYHTAWDHTVIPPNRFRKGSSQFTSIHRVSPWFHHGFTIESSNFGAVFIEDSLRASSRQAAGEGKAESDLLSWGVGDLGNGPMGIKDWRLIRFHPYFSAIHVIPMYKLQILVSNPISLLRPGYRTRNWTKSALFVVLMTLPAWKLGLFQ